MLQAKNVLITGGTGAIGAAICRAVASNGGHVAFTYMSNVEAAKNLSEELDGIGIKHMAAAVDACDSAAINSFVESVEESFGHIDVLINNLGVTQVMPFALIDEEDWDKTVQVNLKSMFLFTKAVIRGMVRRRAGVVLNMGSVAGHRIIEVPVHYASAKAAVSGFTTSLAGEMKRFGIRVNAIAPGLIDGGIGTNVSDRQLAEYNRFCAMGRPGTPEEVAELAVFLSSSKASYINGQTVFIDGGI